MQDFDLAGILINVAVMLPPLIFAVTFHELAHGWAALKLGDPTAQQAGRVTLNPIRHIDPIGTIIVPLAMYLFTPLIFGWAKPVPVVFSNLNSPRRDMILVAAAGPGSNLLMATLWATVPALVFPLLNVSEDFVDVMVQMSGFGIWINVLLALFNMIPIPPLDGGRVLAGLLPSRMSAILDRIEPFGIIIVVLLLIFGPLSDVLLPRINDFEAFFAGLQEFFMRIWRA